MAMEENRTVGGTFGSNGYIPVPGENTESVEGGNDSEGTMEVGSTIDEENSKMIDNEAAAVSDEPEPSKTKYESWYTVNVFLFFLTSFQLVNLLTLTYTDSVLNYISKRFQIPNTMASFIPSSYQVGTVIAILPVSHFGAKWHRPRAICIGVMFMILGLGFCILPHFIMPSNVNLSSSGNGWLCERSRPPLSVVQHYLAELGDQNVTFPPINWTKIDYAAEWRAAQSPAETEKHTRTSWLYAVLNSVASYYHTSDKVISPSLTTPQELPCNENATTYNPSVLLILGHVFIGAGSSPLWPLGVAYLDEHLVSRKMPLYLGIFIGTTLAGPVAGFLLGSLSSAIYVTIDAHNLKPTDPAWIGAWWLGYVIAGGLLVILLLPFYFFPAQLKVTEEKLNERENYQVRVATEMSINERRRRTQSDTTGRCSSDESYLLLCEEDTNQQHIWKTIRDLLRSVQRILSLPLVLCCFFSYIILANLLSGVATFGSTFMQRQFNILRITSDMLIGGVCVPLAIAGTFCGGYIMKKMEFTTNRSLVFNVLMACIGTVFLTILFGLGCETPHMAGINRPYLRESKVNITAKCNIDCHCLKGEINILCSKDNITYISPCYAGCMRHIPGSKGTGVKEAYSDCSCVSKAEQPLTMGPCNTESCTRVLVGAIIAASFGIFILCLCQSPTYTILLRALRNEDKPLAIGLLTVLSRILGFIPAPIWFALAIDKSCIYWGPECKGKAVCKLYNNLGLRINYVGACVACSIVYTATFAVTAAWFIYCKETQYDTDLQSRAERNALSHEDSRRKKLARMRSFTR